MLLDLKTHTYNWVLELVYFKCVICWISRLTGVIAFIVENEISSSISYKNEDFCCCPWTIENDLCLRFVLFELYFLFVVEFSRIDIVWYSATVYVGFFWLLHILRWSVRSFIVGVVWEVVVIKLVFSLSLIVVSSCFQKLKQVIKILSSNIHHHI